MLILVSHFFQTSGIYWPVKGTKVEHGNVSVSIEETSETEDYKLIKLIFWERSRVRALHPGRRSVSRNVCGYSETITSFPFNCDKFR